MGAPLVEENEVIVHQEAVTYDDYIRLSVIGDRVILRRFFFSPLSDIMTPDDIRWHKDRSISFALSDWVEFATGLERCMEAVQGRYRRAHAVILYQHRGYYSNIFGRSMVSYSLRNPSKNNWNISITESPRVAAPVGSQDAHYGYTGRTMGFSALRRDMVEAFIVNIKKHAECSSEQG